jgi:hypothetical protein
MRKSIHLSAIALALLVLGACSTSGGLGDILGGGSSSNNYGTLRGTVDLVDTANRSVVLTNVSNNGSMLSSGGSGNSVRVYYDNSTAVDYQGQSYRPEDLERGDQVDVRVNQNGNQLYATSMSVVYNARTGTSGSSTYPGSGTYGSTFHGVVRSVDLSRGTITIDRGSSGGYATLNTGTNTPVYYNGQTYRTSDLEVGDEVDVRMNGNTVQDITVTRSMSSSSGTYGNTSYSTIRGTVRNVDTARHTIQLDSPSWVSGFNRGSGAMANTIYVSYDPNMSLNVNGQMYPITGLERGDVIDVQVSGSGTNNLVARNITLVRDVRR